MRRTQKKKVIERKSWRCLAYGACLAACLSLGWGMTALAEGPGDSIGALQGGPGAIGGPGTMVQIPKSSQSSGASNSSGGSNSPGNSNTTASGKTETPESKNPNAWKKVNGSYQMANGTVISGVLARGVDVSRWQGEINWRKAAADDVSFAMLGVRSLKAEDKVDPYFHQNMKNALAAGIKVGAYIYSIAKTPQEAVDEANFVINQIKEYPVSFPVAIDMESSDQAALSKSELAAIANAFCRRMEEVGYYPVVYANDTWLNEELDMTQIKYPVWAARYYARPTFLNHFMWQATSTGSVQGINGKVDINFLFKDLSGVVPANVWRNIDGKSYYYQNYVKQVNNWIWDGKGWYYMGSDGDVSRGWIKLSGVYYYLDEVSGKMQIGWHKENDQWYYLNSSGAMTSGWQNVDNAWYYMNRDGVMQTGWQQVDGHWYYLSSSGKRQSGWQQLGGQWYYLNENGERTSGWQQVGGRWYYLNQEGVMQTGHVRVDGKDYYLAQDGQMLSNTTLEWNGAKYQLDASGVMSLAAVDTAAQPAEAGGLAPSAQAGQTPGQTAAQQTPSQQPAASQSGPAQGSQGGVSGGPGGEAGPQSGAIKAENKQ